MAVDSAGAVDFVDRELNALKVLQAVTLFPGTGGADDVRRFGSGACGKRQQRERRNGFKRQLPPPLWLGDIRVPRIDEAQARPVTDLDGLAGPFGTQPALWGRREAEGGRQQAVNMRGRIG